MASLARELYHLFQLYYSFLKFGCFEAISPILDGFVSRQLKTARCLLVVEAVQHDQELVVGGPGISGLRFLGLNPLTNREMALILDSGNAANVREGLAVGAFECKLRICDTGTRGGVGGVTGRTFHFRLSVVGVIILISLLS